MKRFIIYLSNGDKIYTDNAISLVNTRMEINYNQNNCFLVVGDYVPRRGNEESNSKIWILEREIVAIIEK